MFLEMLIHSVKILYGLVKIDSNHWLMAGLLGWYWMILMGTWDRQWPQLRPRPWLFPGKSHGSLHWFAMGFVHWLRHCPACFFPILHNIRHWRWQYLKRKRGTHLTASRGFPGRTELGDGGEGRGAAVLLSKRKEHSMEQRFCWNLGELCHGHHWCHHLISFEHVWTMKCWVFTWFNFRNLGDIIQKCHHGQQPQGVINLLRLTMAADPPTRFWTKKTLGYPIILGSGRCSQKKGEQLGAVGSWKNGMALVELSQNQNCILLDSSLRLKPCPITLYGVHFLVFFWQSSAWVLPQEP